MDSIGIVQHLMDKLRLSLVNLYVRTKTWKQSISVKTNGVLTKTLTSKQSVQQSKQTVAIPVMLVQDVHRFSP
jgi:hypothetical protein